MAPHAGQPAAGTVAIPVSAGSGRTREFGDESPRGWRVQPATDRALHRPARGAEPRKRAGGAQRCTRALELQRGRYSERRRVQGVGVAEVRAGDVDVDGALGRGRGRQEQRGHQGAARGSQATDEGHRALAHPKPDQEELRSATRLVPLPTMITELSVSNSSRTVRANGSATHSSPSGPSTMKAYS